MIEYFSHSESDFDLLSKKSPTVEEYSKFFNRHYDLVAQIEERVTKYGNAQCADTEYRQSDKAFQKTLEE